MSESAADSIDDLISSFSKAHIDGSSQNILRKPREESYIDEPPALPLKLLWDCEIHEFDEVASVIRNLRTELDDAYSDKHVDLDHHCTRQARAQLIRWNISELALENFFELARGNPMFPVIMLLNPTNNSEDLPFPDMVEKSPTLCWIRDVLAEVGLDISDVIILDICPLLSQRRLNMIRLEERADAIEQAYELTKQILKCLKPKILLSCQCQTSNEKWNAAGNALAYELCSSYRKAQNGEVKVINVEGHTIQVIHGFHPMYILYPYQVDDVAYSERNATLQNLFRRVYSSCASRKAESLLLIEVLELVRSFRSYLGVFTRNLENCKAPLDEGASIQQFKDRLSAFSSECEAARVTFHEILSTCITRIAKARMTEQRTVATLLRTIWLRYEDSFRI